LSKIWLLQANLNHCREAQDLWVQSLAAGDFGPGVAAEPWRMLESSNWYLDTADSVAIFFRDGASTLIPTRSLLEAGRGYAVFAWGNFVSGLLYLAELRPLRV
jgi:hypothetical protein